MANPFYSAVGARIRSARESAGLNQDELAEAAGINRSYLSRAERGLQNLSLLTLGRIAAALEVPPAVFFEDVSLVGAKLEGPLRSNARRRVAVKDAGGS